MTSYLYEENKKTTINSEYFKDIDYWQAIDKYEYQYDTKGNLIETIRSQNEDWINRIRPRGKDSLEWSPQFKSEFVFNEINKLTESNHYNFVSGYYWFWNTNTVYLTDNEGAEYSKIYTREFGEADFKFSYEYGRKINSLYDHLDHSFTQIYSWRENLDWKATDRYTRYYSAHTTSSLFDAVTVYPTPSSDYISFDFDGSNAYIYITIFDLRGNPLLSEYANVNSKIDISKLSKGMYFYKLVYDGQHLTGRIIKN
jgi:hypothetical protein